MGIKGLVKQVLTEKENRRYAGLLREKSVSYGEWAAAGEAESERLENRAGQAEGNEYEDEFVVICAGEGAFSAELISGIKRGFPEYGEAGLLYGDEDVWEKADRKQQAASADRRLPWYKPEWSPDLLDSCFYFGSVVILRKDLFLQAPGRKDFLAKDREQITGMEVYRVTDFPAYEQWIHCCVRLAGGYEKGCRSVKHIPGILFHSGSGEAQERFLKTSPFLRECRQRLLGEFRKGLKTDGETEKALLSVVIPSKDQPEILGKCLKGCILAAGLPEGGMLPFEVIVVDNGSSGENRRKIQQLLQERKDRCRRVVYLYLPQEFNFSRMCNLGAEQAEGRVLLFLNDDVELCLPGCLEKMAALACREITGAVGLKLYYPDSVRIQHGGITNLPMGPVHKLQFLEDDKVYYYGANRGYRNVLAVTAACLMTERQKYREAGGFAEELQVAFNDVDFCFRLYELGYQNVCDNEDYAFHHESLSRGADETPEKLDRLLRERDELYQRHPALEGKDPYYSVFLNREGLDTGIRPAYLTAGNRTQEISDTLMPLSLRDCRRDHCLMVRIEDLRAGRIPGYGVILGDNNACYDKMLLFGKVQENSREESAMAGGERKPEESGSAVQNRGNHIEDGEVYAVRLLGQYRPDLEENMPDQVRVGLCGFDVKVKETALPQGRYRLGMAARNRVTGLKLVNWSNRWIAFSGVSGTLGRDSDQRRP